MANWCDQCERADDADVCSVCGNNLVPDDIGPMPWRWKFFFVATAIYLIFRLYQLIVWLSH